MKTPRILAAGALFFLAACGKPSPPAAPPAAPAALSPSAASSGPGLPTAPNLPPHSPGASVPRVPPSEVQRPRPPDDPIEPRVYITANSSSAPVIPAGWPLLLTLTLHAPIAAPLRLAVPSGTWAGLVHLDIPEGWSLPEVPVEASEITLDRVSYGLLVWTLLPAELDALPRGTYRVSALLEAPHPPPGAWSGKVRPPPAEIELVKARPRLTEAEDYERSYLLVRIHGYRKDPAAAEREAEGLVQRHPKYPLATLLHADALATAGKKVEAIQALDRAIEAAVGTPSGPQDLRWNLVRRREELSAEIDTKK